MKIKFLKAHNYNNVKHNADEVVDVPEEIAAYFIRCNVAVELSKEKVEMDRQKEKVINPRKTNEKKIK